MAIRTLAANTNVSALRPLDPSDDIRLNTFVLTLDDTLDVVCARIAGETSTGTRSTGSFSLPASATRTIKANIVAGNSSICTLSAGQTLNVQGNVNGGTQVTAAGLIAGSGSYLNVTGDVTGGTASSTHAISASSATVTIVGNVTGAATSSATGCNITAGVTTITGNVTGGATASANGITLTAGTLTVTGNVYGSPTVAANGITASGVSTVTINGTVRGTGSTGNGVSISTGGTLTINGAIDDTLGSAVQHAGNAASYVWNPPAGALFTSGGAQWIRKIDAETHYTGVTSTSLIATVKSLFRSR